MIVLKVSEADRDTLLHFSLDELLAIIVSGKSENDEMKNDTGQLFI